MRCIKSRHKQDVAESATPFLQPLGVFAKAAIVPSSTMDATSLSPHLQSTSTSSPVYTTAGEPRSRVQGALLAVGGGGVRGVDSSLGRPGCILFTDLALRGWRFPPFLFAEADEKILFDIEVGLSHTVRPLSLLTS